MAALEESAALDMAVKKTISRYDPQFHDLSPLQEPSSFEDRRHRLLDPRDPRPRLLRAGELHHPRCLNLPELHQQPLRVLQQRTLKEAQRAIFFEALNDDNVFSIHGVAGFPPLALLS